MSFVPAQSFSSFVEDVTQFEIYGIDRVWVPEAYGFDAASQMGFLAAKTSQVEIASGVLPLFSRTPALLAMTAAGIDKLTSGRCVLGLGASGPQVIEGWHGLPYDHPLARTREVVEICRAIWRREGPVSYEGVHHRLPMPRSRGTGLGKALKLMEHPVRSRIPVTIAAIGDRNVELTAEIAEGWLPPSMFIPEQAGRVHGAALSVGRTRRSPELPPLEICAGGPAAVTADRDQARRLRDELRPEVALYAGGMGARGKNFYNDLLCRYGFESAASDIQDLYLDGHKDEAAARVPDELLESICLIGSEAEVQDRVAAYHEAGVTMLNIRPVGPSRLGTVRTIKEMCADIN